MRTILEHKWYDNGISFNDDSDTRHKIFNKLIDWYMNHDCFGEGIHQSDDSIIDAPSLLADIADDILCFKIEGEE